MLLVHNSGNKPRILYGNCVAILGSLIMYTVTLIMSHLVNWALNVLYFRFVCIVLLSTTALEPDYGESLFFTDLT